MSPEVAVVRGFLDTVLELPWGTLAPADVDVPRVARHLERTHDGLKDVKDRILEYLAVCRTAGGRGPAGREEARRRPPPTSRPPSSVRGPPGTGKNSVAQSIADALGRPFVRVALGGCATKRRSAGIAARTSGRCPGASSTASPRPASTCP